MTIPRLRGRVGECGPGQGFDGKWFFEISVWDLSGENQAGEPLQYGPFDTDAEAHTEMKKAIKTICDEIEKQATGQVSGKYFDLKAGGVMRPWVEN